MLTLRPEVTQHLTQRLQAFREGFRQNLALIGPPGSGKTFQLQRLLESQPGQLLVIYCPLYRESCRAFIQRLLAAILEAGLRRQPGVEPSSSMQRLIEQARPHLPRTTAAVEAVDQLLARRLYGEAFNRALDTIPLLIQDSGTPCVLMLDEFLYLEDLGLGHAFHELGKRVMTWPSTLFVLTSSSAHRARVILRERLQLLFGQFEMIELEALEPSVAAAWIQQQLKGLRGVGAVSPFLIRWLGGSPWYLSVFLTRLKELATLRRSRTLDESLFLEAAWDVLGNAQGTLHHWCLARVERLSHARHGARAMDILLQIAQGARTTTEVSRRLGRAQVAETFQVLVEQDLANRNGTCWMVPDPLLRCWVSAVLGSQRSEVQVGPEAARARLDAYIRGLWQEWTQVSQLSFFERMAGLFAQFADETVSLDSKTGRLPRFERIATWPNTQPGGAPVLIAEGEGRRWCAAIEEAPIDESRIASFEAFCRTQAPKPSRKVVIAKSGMDQNARLLAKAANMWVWEGDDLMLLSSLYGRFPA